MLVYLQYLLRRFQEAGGTVLRRYVSSLDEIDDGSVIVNCAGLGAGELAADGSVRPIRGQHVVVKNPGISEFLSEDTGLSPDLLCIYPHGKTVVLGDTAIDGEATLKEDPVAVKAILARCAAVEPRLVNAEVVGSRVGARPTRPEVRVEADSRQDGVPVFHNYGHGGSGVTLSWGCAEDWVTDPRARLSNSVYRWRPDLPVPVTLPPRATPPRTPTPAPTASPRPAPRR